MQRILTRTTTQDWGFTIVRRQRDIVVASVTPLSIAHLSELQVGDIIVSINNTICSTTAIHILNGLISLGDQLILQIMRTSSIHNTVRSGNSQHLNADVIELDNDDSDEDRMYRTPFRDSIFSDDDDDEEDDDDEDSIERFVRDARTSITHQRVRSSAPPRAPVPYTRGEVVDLISDDDEPPRRAPPPPAAARQSLSNTNDVGLQRNPSIPATQISVGTSSSGSASLPNTTGKRSLESTSAKAYSISGSGFKRRKLVVGGVEIKIEFEPKKFGEANIGDDVVEVEDEESNSASAGIGSSKPSSSALATDGIEVVTANAVAGTASSADSDDFEGDFQIVGNTMQVASDMPHQRYSCTMHPFRVAPPNNNIYGRPSETPHMLAERNQINFKHCLNCYCYVCDSKVSDCGEWEDHCHATHKEAKWKIEKDARNSKILRLMSAPKRSAFFARYRDAMMVNRMTGRQTFGTFLDEDDSEDAFLDADLSSRAQCVALSGANNQPGQLSRGKAGVAKDLTRSADLISLIRLKLHCSRPSGSAIGGDRDKFLEASELLLRTLVSPKHAGENSGLIATAFLSWILHPCCNTEVRTVFRNEVSSAAQRSMILNAPIYVSLRELLSIDEATLNRLRTATASTGTTGSTPLPTSIVNLPENVQGMLIAELLALENYPMIKLIAQKRPNLGHHLMVLYLRSGTLLSCREAVALACQNNTQQRPFASLRTSIQDIEISKLFRILAVAVSYNINRDIKSGPHNPGWSLPGDFTDLVFNVMFMRLCNDTATYDESICAGVAAVMTDGRRTLHTVLEWIDQEVQQQPTLRGSIALYIFVAYANWRVKHIPGSPLMSVSGLVGLLITHGVCGGLRGPLLITLANLIQRYFVPPALDAVAGGVAVNTLLACHIAQRALTMLSPALPLSCLDQEVRNAWAIIPELKKAQPGEICVSSGPVRSASSVPSDPYVAGLKFCPGKRPVEYSLNTVERGQGTGAELHRIVATYCDIHYTYDTFLMCLVAPKTTAESNIAIACWSHALNLAEADALVQRLECPLLMTDDNINSAGYITFLTANRETLSIVWKSLLKHMYCYMHALFHMDNFSLMNLLNHFSAALKIWLGNVDVVHPNQFSTHSSCQGLSPSQIVELQALDVTVRMMYQFSTLLMKYQDSAGAAPLSLGDVRAFKAAIMRLENVNTQASLAARLCHMFLLDYPTVSTRAVWHSFWRRFLLSLVSKRNTSSSGDEVAIETHAVLLFLEDWGPLKDLIAKAPDSPRTVNHFITGLTLLLKSDFISMNYAAVSGSHVLKNALESIACCKFTVPLSSNLLQPLPLISEKCVQQPDSGLAHLVSLFSTGLLQVGAMDYQPFFAFILRKRADASVASQVTPPDQMALLEQAIQTVNRAHESCVSLVSSAGRNPNISYAKVLCGCVCLRRFDLVEKLVSAGFSVLLHPMAPSHPMFVTDKAKLLSSALMMAHNAKDFELLLAAMDPFVADVYTSLSSVGKMAPVIRKFCPSPTDALATLASVATTGVTVESSLVKKLKFYHYFDPTTFFQYWNSIPVEQREHEKMRVLSWMKLLEGTPRFRTETHIAILSQLMDRGAFAAYLVGPELDNPAFDKYQVMQALVKIVHMDTSSSITFAPTICKILLGLPSITSSMRSNLRIICNDTVLLPPTSVGTEGGSSYSDARTLLLYLGDPLLHNDGLAELYVQSYNPEQKEGVCRILLNSDDDIEKLAKLLLAARDYEQLFATMRTFFYGGPSKAPGVSHSHTLPPVMPVAAALEKLRTSLVLTSVYSPALVGAGGGNASLNIFQKELFDDHSFVVCLGKFLLFLQAQHIDDKTIAYPAPLGPAIEKLIEHVKQLAHGDVVIGSYLRIHMKFSTANAAALFTDCTNCNFFSMPFTPRAFGNSSTPATFCYDTVVAILRAPKFYTVSLSLFWTLHSLSSLPQQQVIKPGPSVNEMLVIVLNSPCKYIKDQKAGLELVPEGLLWVPRGNSSNAASNIAGEICKMVQSFGAGFSEVLLGPIMQRLKGVDINHLAGGKVGEGSPPHYLVSALQQWASVFNEDMKRIVDSLMPRSTYAFLSDLFQLHISFNSLGPFTINAQHALCGPYAAEYKTILVNLLMYAVANRTTDTKMVLHALMHEVHRPDNTFARFFAEEEINKVMDQLSSSEDLKHNVRMALVQRNGKCPFAIKDLLKIPRVFDFIGRDFNTSISYDPFTALNHAQSYMALWIAMAATPYAELAFQQACDCFRAIVEECRTNTVAARVRTQVEEVAAGLGNLFMSYPDRAAEKKAMVAEAKQKLKTKAAVVKALAVLN